MSEIFDNNPMFIKLFDSIIIPSMETFKRMGIIEEIMPSISSKKIEFECFLLCTICTMTMLERKNTSWFNSNDVFTEFTNATISFYENSGLYKFEDESQITKYIFNRWSQYEMVLSRFNSKESDYLEFYNLVYEYTDGTEWFIENIEGNKLNFKLSMIEILILILAKYDRFC